MKGHRTGVVFDELRADTLEKLCALHGSRADKRGLWLIAWVRACTTGGYLSPEVWWAAHVPQEPGTDAAEADKRLRRWISWLNRELEKMLVWQSLDDAPAQIPGTLLRVLPPSRLLGLYVNQAMRVAQEQEDLDLIWVCNSYRIRRLANQQTDASLEQIFHTVLDNTHYINLTYHRRKVDSLHLLSGLYLEDPSVRERSGDLFPNDADIHRYCLETQGTPLEAEYQLIQARLKFRDLPAFEAAVQRTEEMTAAFAGKQKDRVLRRLCFVRVIAGYAQHLGLADMREYAGRVHAYNESLGYPDAVGFFHFMVLSLLNGETAAVNQWLETRGAYYLLAENEYLARFLKSLGALLYPRQVQGQPSQLQALSYSRNYLVALWSSLFFAAHHYRLGNLDFCTVVLERLRKRLLKMPALHAAREESWTLMRWLERLCANPGAQVAAPHGLGPVYDAVIGLAGE